MKTATIDQVQARLPQLLQELSDDEELVIISEGRPVGRLMRVPAQTGSRVPGRGKGKLTINAEDDEHLKDFAEYTSSSRPV